MNTNVEFEVRFWKEVPHSDAEASLPPADVVILTRALDMRCAYDYARKQVDFNPAYYKINQL